LRIVEYVAPKGTGTKFVFKDVPLSFETLAHSLVGRRQIGHDEPASSFAFAFPTTALNTVGTWTQTFKLAGQASEVWESAYNIITKWNLHADAKADEGLFKFSYETYGRKSAASGNDALRRRVSVAACEMMNLRAGDGQNRGTWHSRQRRHDRNGLATRYQSRL
jgi:hypothetical protein